MRERLCAVLLATSLLFAGCAISPARNSVSNSGGGNAVGQLYVATPSSIVRFSDAFTSNGNVVPAATISGASTGLSSPQRLVLDAAADRLYVANAGANSVLIFEKVSTLSGNVAPNRTIAGAATTLSGPNDLALDTLNNLLYVASGTNILVFAGASTINGNSPPVRSINMGVAVSGLFLDATNNQLYVADGANNVIDRLDGASSQSVIGIAGGVIAGTNTLLSSPSGLTLDSNGRLLVSNAAAPLSITFYGSAAFNSGNIAPVANIHGASTLLASPGQMALNKTVTTGEVYVADDLAGSILIFKNISTATGNVAPARTIAGASTGLAVNGVNGVALDTTR